MDEADTEAKDKRARIGGLIDPVSVFGFFGAIVLIWVSVAVTAKDPHAFLNWPGMLIVLGGVGCATFISFPGHQLRRVLPALIIALRPNRRNVVEDLEQVVAVARVWQRGEIRDREREVRWVKSRILRVGLEWTLAGMPIQQVQEMMAWEHERTQLQEDADAEILLTMAAYSPAFGMLGTLLGLINMLYELEEASLVHIGSNMALALITTFYGLLCANLFFMPLSVKLQGYFSERSRDRRVAIEAVRLINKHVGPAQLRETLNGITFGENAITSDTEDA